MSITEETVQCHKQQWRKNSEWKSATDDN